MSARRPGRRGTGGAGTGPGRPRVLVAHPSAELYGADRVALETVIALVDEGWDVLVALAGDGPLRPLVESAGARVVVLPAPVLRKSLLSPVGALRFAVQNLRLLPAVLRLVRGFRPHVVYVSTVTVPLWLAAARLLRRRAVCHVHEAEADLPRPVRLALAAPLLLARLVLTNSEVSREVVVADLPLLRQRVRVVYNGVPGPDRWSEPRPAVGGRARLVLVGRVSPRKGTDVAVRALAVLRERGVDAELTLVGGVFPGYEWFEREVRDEARRSGVEDRVHWAGVLPVVWPSLDAADVALVPSRVEPFGNAAVEAMLACRPVVVGDTQGLREVVRAGLDGERVAAGDPEALADGVQRVLHDWAGARERAVRAREDAGVRFGTQRYRSEVAGLLALAADRPAPAAAAHPARAAGPPS